MKGLDQHQLTQLNTHLAAEEAGQAKAEAEAEAWQELQEHVYDDLLWIGRYFDRRDLFGAASRAESLAERLDDAL